MSSSSAGSEDRTVKVSLRPVLRLCTFLLVLGLCSVAFMAHGVERRMARVALDGGGALWGLTSAHRAGEVQRIEMNGAQLFVRTATVDAPFERVLDEAHGACGAAGFAPRTLPTRLLGLDGVIDERSERDGTVACFEGEGLGFEGLLKSLQEAAESGDLGRLGRLRYSYARQEADGRTAVLSLWSEGELSPNKLFPAEGDAPGADDPAVPRPPEARRLLTVRHSATARPLLAYKSTRPLRELMDEYLGELRRVGLQVDRPEDSRSGESGAGKAWARDGRSRGNAGQLWLLRSPEALRWLAFVEEGEETWVVVTPLP